MAAVPEVGDAVDDRGQVGGARRRVARAGPGDLGELLTGVVDVIDRRLARWLDLADPGAGAVVPVAGSQTGARVGHGDQTSGTVIGIARNRCGDGRGVARRAGADQGADRLDLADVVARCSRRAAGRVGNRQGAAPSGHVAGVGAGHPGRHRREDAGDPTLAVVGVAGRGGVARLLHLDGHERGRSARGRCAGDPERGGGAIGVGEREHGRWAAAGDFRGDARLAGGVIEGNPRAGGQISSGAPGLSGGRSENHRVAVSIQDGDRALGHGAVDDLGAGVSGVITG